MVSEVAKLAQERTVVRWLQPRRAQRPVPVAVPDTAVPPDAEAVAAAPNRAMREIG